VTSSGALVDDTMPEESCVVTTALRMKLWAFGTEIDKLARFQALTLTDSALGPARKLLTPSVRVAPCGMPSMISDISVSAPDTVSLLSVTGDPTFPADATADQDSVVVLTLNAPYVDATWLALIQVGMGRVANLKAFGLGDAQPGALIPCSAARQLMPGGRDLPGHDLIAGASAQYDGLRRIDNGVTPYF
jgi:hypothetical protein